MSRVEVGLVERPRFRCQMETATAYPELGSGGKGKMRIGRWCARWVVVVALAALVAGCAKQPQPVKSEGEPVAAKPAAAAKGTIEVLVPCGQVGPFSKIYKRSEEHTSE